MKVTVEIEKLVDGSKCEVLSICEADYELASILVDYAEEKYDEKIRAALAYNPNIPKEILEKIIIDESYFVKMAAAKNVNTPIDVLVKFATDKIEKNDHEKEEIAKVALTNPRMPSDILKKFAESENNKLKAAAARNINMPEDILSKLAYDENEDVSFAALSNPSMPQQILCNETLSYSQKIAVAFNPNAPLDVLVALIELSNTIKEKRDKYSLKNALSMNHNLPEKIRKKLKSELF